jgi:hypothetical protein
LVMAVRSWPPRSPDLNPFINISGKPWNMHAKFVWKKNYFVQLSLL